MVRANSIDVDASLTLLDPPGASTVDTTRKPTAWRAAEPERRSQRPSNSNLEPVWRLLRVARRARLRTPACASAAGLALFTGVRPGGSYLALVLPGAVLSGLGMGLGLVGSTIAATQGVPRAQSGLASGLLNMSRLFGGALGLAVLSTIAAGASHASSGASPLQRLTDGYGLAFRVGASITVVAAFVALGFLRPRPTAQPVTVAEGCAGRETASEPETMAA